MSKLLLILTPYISFESFKSPLFTERNNALVTDMPLGAFSISAYARKYAKADVRILDINPKLYIHLYIERGRTIFMKNYIYIYICIYLNIYIYI